MFVALVEKSNVSSFGIGTGENLFNPHLTIPCLELMSLGTSVYSFQGRLYSNGPYKVVWKKTPQRSFLTVIDKLVFPKDKFLVVGHL